MVAIIALGPIGVEDNKEHRRAVRVEFGVVLIGFAVRMQLTGIPVEGPVVEPVSIVVVDQTVRDDSTRCRCCTK